MISKTHQVHHLDQATHSIKTLTKIQLLLRNEVSNWQQVGFFTQTYKTKHTTDESQKSQHKYIVSKSLSGLETFPNN